MSTESPLRRYAGPALLALIVLAALCLVTLVYAVGETLLEHGRWAGVLTIDEGPEADRLRERAARARDADPSAGGFAGIYLFGPGGLVADDAARRQYFGEAL